MRGTQNASPFRPDRCGAPITGVDLGALDRYARAHHGLVSWEAALERGATAAEWRDAIAAGQVDQRFHRVVRLFGAAETQESRIAAAILACGGGALASHRSAARLWGVPRSELDPVDVTLPDRRRRSRLAGVCLHRPRDLLDLRPIWRQGIPTTDPLRTLVDLGAVDPGAVRTTLVHLVTHGFLTVVSARRALERHAGRGRPGIVALRRALEEWELGDRPADSELELRMARLVVRHHLPPMEFHAIVAGYEVDFLVTGVPLVVECDGWAHHGADRDQFELDRRRDADLLAIGVSTLRVTWRQVTRSPGPTAARIERAIEALAPGTVRAHRVASR